jgi:hypothetical protein
MSEEDMNEDTAERMSSEDKFFGVKTQHGKTDVESDSFDEESDLEIEVIDDHPSEEKRPPKKAKETGEPAPSYNDGFSDKELQSYTKGVQKRINQLRAINHSDKRKIGEAQRMRDEAVNLAKTQHGKLREYESLLAKGQNAIIQTSKGKAQFEIDTAKKELKKAHEEGNADLLVSSQEQLNSAQAQLRDMEARAVSLKRNLDQQAKQQAYERDNPQPAPQQQVEVSHEQNAWMQENPWFQPSAQPGQPVNPMHKEMTAVGLAIHDNLFHEGITANTDSQIYYSEINKRMRDRFPDYKGFQEGREERSAPPRQRRNTSVVAPTSSRNNGAKTRKVSLTQTQEALAKRLGVTNEQYAEQMLKQEIG